MLFYDTLIHLQRDLELHREGNIMSNSVRRFCSKQQCSLQRSIYSNSFECAGIKGFSRSSPLLCSVQSSKLGSDYTRSRPTTDISTPLSILSRSQQSCVSSYRALRSGRTRESKKPFCRYIFICNVLQRNITERLRKPICLNLWNVCWTQVDQIGIG